MLRWVWMLLLCGFGLVGPVVSQDLGLYSGEAPVASQDDVEKAKALGPALINALVKLSGDSSLASDANALKLRDQAEGLVVSTSFRDELEPGVGTTTLNRTYLVAVFKPEGLEKLLFGLGRAVWSGARPQTLVLILIDDGVNKRLANAGQIAALGALTHAARDRGLPLVLPYGDADDQAQLDPNLLWGGPPTGVLPVLPRYRASTALIARLSRGSTGWSARNTWLGSGAPPVEWSANAVDSAGVLLATVNGLADRLAERFAIPASERKTAEYRVIVNSVGSAEDYGRVLDYLGRQGYVRQVAPVGASGNALELKLTLDLSLDRFVRMLAYDAVLLPDDNTAGGADAVLRMARPDAEH